MFLLGNLQKKKYPKRKIEKLTIPFGELMAKKVSKIENFSFWGTFLRMPQMENFSFGALLKKYPKRNILGNLLQKSIQNRKIFLLGYLFFFKVTQKEDIPFGELLKKKYPKRNILGNLLQKSSPKCSFLGTFF